jgi:DNA-binding SARP family transcriptional activator
MTNLTRPHDGAASQGPLRALVDFINHGLLPFTGRTRQADHIVGLWRGATEAPGLVAILLLGEAGMGKSRLIEEVAARILKLEGAVVHAKLFPESATSIVPLLARALWRFSEARPQLKIEPGENLSSLLLSLRKLARLRRTILIIEDLHLLGGDALGDLSLLLDALADEQLTVLAVARPVELAARGVLERHLLEEIALEGLDDDELETLWRKLFGSDADPSTLRALGAATAGNPLAVRSALRGVLKSGALAGDAVRGWRMTVPAADFSERLRRSVEYLSEGMAAHLTERERTAAARIATLGEIVARESALAMIDGAEGLIEALIFKGILVQTTTPIPPLPERPSRHPLLSFTHTLLHRRLVRNIEVDTARLVPVIASGLPLYSALPLLLLEESAGPFGASDDDLLASVTRTLDVALALDSGPDWRLSLSVWNAAAALIERNSERWSGGERAVLGARLILRKLSLLHRDGSAETAENRELLRQVMAITSASDSERMASYHLAALVNLSLHRYKETSSPDPEIRRQIEEYVLRHPSLRFSDSYVAHLNQIVFMAAMVGDRESLRAVETRMKSLVAEPEASESFRREITRSLSADLLALFETPEELRERLDSLPELEAITGDRHYPGILFCKIGLLESIGRMDEALRACEAGLACFRERGLQQNVAYSLRTQLIARASFGIDLDELAAEAERICREMPAWLADIQYSHMGLQLVTLGLLRGERGWAGEMIGRFIRHGALLHAEHLLPIAAANGTLAEALETMEGDDGDRLFIDLGRAAVAGLPATGPTLDDIRALLRKPILRLEGIILLRAVADLVEAACAAAGSRDPAEPFAPLLASALAGALEFLAERNLLPPLRSLLTSYGHYLTRPDLAAWHARAEEIAARRNERAEPEGSTTIEISMLGAIEVRRPGAENTRPRGARLRTLLGLMVVDRMLEEPLTQREFCRLAADEGTDPENARKTVNLAVHRLREIVGYDAILTDAETPRLNPRLVRVDLLDADRLLGESIAALREGSPMRALAPLLDTLEITRGEVPFPTLYDEFFEAAREDFENRIREAILKIARGLLRDGDASSAELALRRGFATMPEDEEIAELLRDSLIQLGKRAEAERIRLRVGEMA